MMTYDISDLAGNWLLSLNNVYWFKTLKYIQENTAIDVNSWSFQTENISITEEECIILSELHSTNEMINSFFEICKNKTGLFIN